MLKISRTYLEMPVIVHEFGTRPVPENELHVAQPLHARAKLYRMTLPPDQLNPDGEAGS